MTLELIASVVLVLNITILVQAAPPTHPNHECIVVQCKDVTCNSCFGSNWCDFSTTEELNHIAWWKCFPASNVNCSELPLSDNNNKAFCVGKCPTGAICDCFFGKCSLEVPPYPGDDD